MKAIMLMFDTLCRRMLSPYGCDWTITPNFQRLAGHTATFDNAYVGSMPCMPARRELHTGRLNFLHRAWGPIEPFDDSMPQMLKQAGVYTHLISDHQHYWEDGGATYHNRYSSWEIVRGQEGDCWKGQVADPPVPEHYGRMWRQDLVNRQYFDSEDKQPLARVFRLGMEFLEKNKDSDNWFLHWECFDPHEPFFAQKQYRDLYPEDYRGPRFDWPEYGPVTEPPEAVAHLRRQYAALLTMCDTYLGKFLDYMDANDLWKDTLLIVNTDHGFLLGEHDRWAKCCHPWFDETAHIPFFLWDPRHPEAAGTRRNALIQNIDVPETLLRFFGQQPTKDMQGFDLEQTLIDDTPVRQYALFGLHGGQINVTDGRYVYMRDPLPGNSPLYNYTVMPTHMRCMFSPGELATATLSPGFSFTKGVPLLRINAAEDFSGDTTVKFSQGTCLYDLEQDPGQKHPIRDPAIESRMIAAMISLMRQNDAPPEQYTRMGLTASQAPA